MEKLLILNCLLTLSLLFKQPLSRAVAYLNPLPEKKLLPTSDPASYMTPVSLFGDETIEVVVKPRSFNNRYVSVEANEGKARCIYEASIKGLELDEYHDERLKGGWELRKYRITEPKKLGNGRVMFEKTKEWEIWSGEKMYWIYDYKTAGTQWGGVRQDIFKKLEIDSASIPIDTLNLLLVPLENMAMESRKAMVEYERKKKEQERERQEISKRR